MQDSNPDSPNPDAPASSDLTILGGGLAGLSLALQCRQAMPSLRICVLEKSRHPAPEAAHKVGESTVELATHYFAEVLGLKEHLLEEQLPKHGLRFYFPSGDNRTIEKRLELGGRLFPPKPSFQLDRGRFENFLAERCRSEGIEFVDGATIQEVQLARGKKPHSVEFVRDKKAGSIETRWVADCSGRAAILKRKLGLEKPATHYVNAAWFRMGAEIKVDDWTDDPLWHTNYGPDNARWYSTNHMMGKGYWVWLIPLASGNTSIGIVADESVHALSDYNSLEKAFAWLERFEPQVADKLLEHKDKIQDFLAMKRYARECKQVFSPHRWGITGEAGMFLDPFYSPGSDFIAFGNTFLTELIRRDMEGRSIAIHARMYDAVYKQFHTGTAPVYQDQYSIFGHQQVMPVKILWDYLIYWNLSAYIFCHDRSTSLRLYMKHRKKFKRMNQMNRFMQPFFREWASQVESYEATGEIDLADMPIIFETNRSLTEELDDKTFDQRFADNIDQIESLFWEIVDFAGIDCRVPIRRKRYPKARKNSFEVVFEAIQRRLNPLGTVDGAEEVKGVEASVEPV